MKDDDVWTLEEQLLLKLTKGRSAPCLPGRYPTWHSFTSFQPSMLAHLRLPSRVNGDPRFIQVPEPWVKEFSSFPIGGAHA